MVAHTSEPRPAARLPGARVLVVEARYYEAIADALLDGVRAACEEAGVAIDVLTVDGALEVPACVAIALDAAAAKGAPYEAVVTLGCVIRGETAHFDIVAFESARALMDLSVARKIPLGNGILTVEDEAQAWARAKRSEMDKGGGAARAAIGLAAIARRLTAEA